MVRTSLATLVLALVAVGCSDEHSQVKPLPRPSQPSLTVDELLSAPDSLRVDGMTLSAEARLSRDMMLGIPNGSPLAAGVLLNGSPPGSLPASITDVYLWVIRDSSAVWDTTMSFSGIASTYDGAHLFTVRGGPKWGPDILVDVVVGVRTSPSKVSFVLIPGVLIVGYI